MFTVTTSMSKYNSHDSHQNVTFAKKFCRCKSKKKTSLLYTIKELLLSHSIPTLDNNQIFLSIKYDDVYLVMLNLDGGHWHKCGQIRG